MSSNIITISRQFGSGGREIGKSLAERLHVPFYDKEILIRAAQESGISQSLFEDADEQPTNSFLYSWAFAGQPFVGSFAGYNDCITNDKLFALMAETIEKIAKEGSCVIVGRCADYILRDCASTVSVFVHTDMQRRIERVMELNKLTEEQARNFIKKTDKRRASYYNFYADGKWGLASNYDLSVNSGRLGINRSVEVIQYFVEQFS